METDGALDNREEGEADGEVDEMCVSTVDYNGLIIEYSGANMDLVREQAAKTAVEYAYVQTELKKLITSGGSGIPIATLSGLLGIDSGESPQAAEKPITAADGETLKRKLEEAAAVESGEVAETNKPAVVPCSSEKSSKVLFYEYSTKAKLKPEFEYTTTTDKQPKFGCILMFWGLRFESKQMHARKTDAKADAIEVSLSVLYEQLLRKGRLMFEEIDFQS
jgi:hypothetical protein